MPAQVLLYCYLSFHIFSFICFGNKPIYTYLIIIACIVSGNICQISTNYWITVDARSETESYSPYYL